MKRASKIIAILSSAAILVTQSAFASADTEKYYAFGDSITAAYGLEDISQGYVSLLGEQLGTDTVNYAVNGYTAEDCLAQLESAEIADADYITLSIGSNNLLGPFTRILCEAAGAENFSELNTRLAEIYGEGGINGMMNLAAFLNEVKTALTDNAELNAACDLFAEETFGEILSLLKEKAPDAELCIANLYNPYYGVDIVFAGTSYLPLGALADTYITRINKAFDSASEDDYTLVDVYSAFNTQGLTNVSISSDFLSSNLDPHPNAAGNQVLLNLFSDALSDILYGDVNGDGVINLIDLVRLCKACVGTLTITAEENPAADCARDGKIDISDFSRLMRYIAGFDVVLGAV